MNFLLKTIVLCVFLVSCASHHSKTEGTQIGKKSRQRADNKIPKPSFGVMFDSISKEEFDLVFENITSDHDIEIRLRKDSRLIPLSEGVWELTGIELNGTFYGLMSSSKKFTFKVTPKKIIYAGTYLLGCPQTNQESIESLKKMKFFNRHELTSNQGSCELVIGDDWKTFRKKLIKRRKYKWLNSTIGF
jgi:hypothetical protein